MFNVGRAWNILEIFSKNYESFEKNFNPKSLPTSDFINVSYIAYEH